MFVNPPTVRTEVFARVPDHLRVCNRTSRWASIHRGGRQTDCFLEGPSFDRAGNLYVVDVCWGRVFRVTPSGSFEMVSEYDGEPNGLKIHRDGRIFIADFRHGIMLLHPDSGKVEPLLTECGAFGQFRGVNDLAFDINGDLYFTDQGLTGFQDPGGRLYRWRPGGQIDCVLQNIPGPNGVVIDRESATVFLNVTRDNSVWRVPMDENGRAFKVGAFVRLSGGVGPDGLAIDEAGGIAVAHLGLGTVWVFSALGEPIARVRSCAGLATTNLAYGGADRRSLFITESETGQILVAQLTQAGRTMFSHGNEEAIATSGASAIQTRSGSRSQ